MRPFEPNRCVCDDPSVVQTDLPAEVAAVQNVVGVMKARRLCSHSTASDSRMTSAGFAACMDTRWYRENR